MSSRKRSHSVVEENRIECPFKIIYPGPLNRKRDEERSVPIQVSPFSPIGKFKSHHTMDLHYAIEPSERWLAMPRYKSFVCTYPSAP